MNLLWFKFIVLLEFHFLLILIRLVNDRILKIPVRREPSFFNSFEKNAESDRLAALGIFVFRTDRRGSGPYKRKFAWRGMSRAPSPAIFNRLRVC